MVHGGNNLSIYCHMYLILAVAVMAKNNLRNTYKSQHETVLADLNQYMAKNVALVNNFNR